MPDILIIDDDESLASMLAQYLSKEGFKTSLAHNGEDGIHLAQRHSWDAILLYIMLPGIDGLDVLRKLRVDNSVPILMLTAKGHDDARVEGLETGADDYLTKPFNPKELLARLNALLRRGSFAYHSPSNDLILDNLRLSLKSGKVQWKEKALVLTAVEFRLLETMLRAKNPVKSRDQLSEIVQGRPHQTFGRSVDVHISNLRKKIAATCDGKLEIEAVRGQGYRIRVTK